MCQSSRVQTLSSTTNGQIGQTGMDSIGNQRQTRMQSKATSTVRTVQSGSFVALGTLCAARSRAQTRYRLVMIAVKSRRANGQAGLGRVTPNEESMHR